MDDYERFSYCHLIYGHLFLLKGDSFASSDLNELYRRVLNRNIRLQRLLEIEAPSVIIKNEKRMLQESVDALSIMAVVVSRYGVLINVLLNLSVKCFEVNKVALDRTLLGKRVDYSGRSVIVVDPELRLDQCGLPKIMALELFKSHVFAGFFERELAPNFVLQNVWLKNQPLKYGICLKILYEDIPCSLTVLQHLHRLGIQAFYPILVDGKAIKIHPLVCGAYNADFDGDQMAVHVPLSKAAQDECEDLILSTKNILSAS